MNYNSIEAILQSDVSNMTVIRNNVKNDDDTDSIDGVSWFQFNDQVVDKIYISGNSWIGLGSLSEHLKVNRRDGAMYYIYREEGTLYNYYRFLKIRCSGYTYYGASSDDYAISYDVILWDTGDILLHILKFPKQYNNGIYSLTDATTSYTYTVSDTSVDVTFHKTDNGFEVLNSVIKLDSPYRSLLRHGTQIYTVTNDGLSNLGSIELTSDVFLNNGVDQLILFKPYFRNFDSVEVLCQSKANITLSDLIITGAPPLPQVVFGSVEEIPERKSIQNFGISSSDDVLYTITFDNQASWKYYNGNEWVIATDINEGMSNTVVNNLTADILSDVVTSNKYQFRCALLTTNSYVKTIAVKY